MNTTYYWEQCDSPRLSVSENPAAVPPGDNENASFVPPGDNEPDVEAMRRQMDILRQKLSLQEIVNERLLRQSMSRSMSRINRRHRLQGLLCLMLIPYTYFCFVRQLGFSLLFWVYTALMMLVMLGYILYVNLHLRSGEVLGRDLLMAQQQAQRARRLESGKLKVGLPMLALWIAFFIYEILHCTELADDRPALILLLVVSLAAGLALGFFIRRKALRQYQELICSIEEQPRSSAGRDA